MLNSWLWVTKSGDFFGLSLAEFREAGINNPNKRTPRLNYALLGDFIEQFMADHGRH